MKFVQEKKVNFKLLEKYLYNAQVTNQFTNYGKTVQRLEERARTMLKITDDKAVIATSSGASAFQAILYATLQVYGEQSISSQAYTFPCAFQGLASNAMPLEIDDQQNVIIESNKGLLVVTNCFGHLQNLDYVLNKHPLVIFDNAATPYSFWRDTNSINLGIASFISLHHTKPIGFGEGGLAIVNKNLEKFVRSAINFGIIENKPTKFGSNFKMSEIAAASILQWWDQFNIDNLANKYRANYTYKLNNSKTKKVYKHHGNADLFPNCLPIIHSKPTHKFKDSESRKYYKPIYNLESAVKLYNHIECQPISTRN